MSYIKPNENSEESVSFDEAPVIFDRDQKAGLTTHKSKYKGLKTYNPYDEDSREFEGIRIIPVTYDMKAHIQAMDLILEAIQNGTENSFGSTGTMADLFGLEKGVEIVDTHKHTVKNFSPDEYRRVMAEIKSSYSFEDGDFRNIVVFSTSKSDSSPDIESSEYVEAKNELIDGFLPSQALSFDEGRVFKEAMEKDRIKNATAVNLMASIYAKVGGVPWVTEQPENDAESDIYVGLRSGFRESNYYYGVAQVFDRFGKWVDSINCPEDAAEGEQRKASGEFLKKTLRKALEHYENKLMKDVGKSELKEVDRVTIHQLGHFTEKQKKAINEVGENRDVDFILVSFIDNNILRLYGDNKDKKIERGEFAKLNSDTGIIACSEGGEDSGTPKPLPIRCNPSDYSNIESPPVEDAAKQAFYLTKLHWGDIWNDGTRLPITLVYSEKVAKSLREGTVPRNDTAKSLPWFL